MNKFLFVKIIKSSYCFLFFRRFNQNAQMSCLRHKQIRGLPKVNFLAEAEAVAEGSQNLLKMPLEDIVTYCKIKRKVTLKWCRPCEKYVLKKQYRMHIQTPLHREVVNDGEKHSSHKTKDDDFETEDRVGRSCQKLGAQILHEELPVTFK